MAAKGEYVVLLACCCCEMAQRAPVTQGLYMRQRLRVLARRRVLAYQGAKHKMFKLSSTALALPRLVRHWCNAARTSCLLLEGCCALVSPGTPSPA